jgi:F-type H+-transporting ATPase subunit b
MTSTTMTSATVRRILVSLLATQALCLAALCHAQEPANPQPQPNHQPGVGQQLVRESREAAGEDDNDKLKHSSSVLKLAKYTGLNIEHTYWLSIFLNFVGIGLLVNAFYKWGIPTLIPAPGPYMRQRSVRIRQAMEDARQASEDARRRMSDIESRLSRLDAEVAEMRASAEKDAVAEEERIKAAAAEDARKIIASAELEIAAAAKSARRELTAYAADLAVALARKQIQVDAATDQALVRSFAQHIAATGDVPKGGK